jgi:hypothetical protein
MGESGRDRAQMRGAEGELPVHCHAVKREFIQKGHEGLAFRTDCRKGAVQRVAVIKRDHSPAPSARIFQKSPAIRALPPKAG